MFGPCGYRSQKRRMRWKGWERSLSTFLVFSRAKYVKSLIRLEFAHSQLDFVMLKIDFFTRKIDRVTPKIDRVTRKIDRVTPKIDRATPKIDRVTPKIDRVTPNIDRVTPNIDRVTLKIDLVPLKNNCSVATSQDLLDQSRERETHLRSILRYYNRSCAAF